jgi:hypothetical protein
MMGVGSYRAPGDPWGVVGGECSGKSQVVSEEKERRKWLNRSQEPWMACAHCSAASGPPFFFSRVFQSAPSDGHERAQPRSHHGRRPSAYIRGSSSSSSRSSWIGSDLGPNPPFFFSLSLSLGVHNKIWRWGRRGDLHELFEVPQPRVWRGVKMLTGLFGWSRLSRLGLKFTTGRRMLGKAKTRRRRCSREP